ncbi:MAG: leucine-rich repeat protein, partial [Lachnospiraceae bacterium]|nr:leucine-rich repeat protein [Lachnospiraceae bacterium]
SYGYYDYDLNYGLLILPDSIRNIGERAFYGCEGITNIEWNLYVVDGENEIGNELFANCAELIDVMFNSEPKFVPGMFKGCKKLKGMKELSPTRSGSDPIEVEPLESIFEDCKKLTFNGTNDYCPIIMPDDTTVIGARAYKNCLNFADEWEIPSNITSIGKEAFFGCNKLKTVYAIDSNLEFVGANAFNGDVAFVTNDSNIQLLLIAGLNQEEHAYTTWNGIDDVEPGAIVHLDGTSIEGTVTIGRNAQVFIPEDVDVELKGTIILERDASITLEERSTLTLIGTLSGPSDSAYRSSLILKGTLEGNGSIGSRIDVYTVLTDDMVTMSGISEGLPFTGEEIVDVVPVVKFDYFSEEYSVYDPDTETGDYICTYKNNIKAGTASVVITPAENGRLLGGSVSKTFKIVKGTIDGFIWEVDDDTTDADVTVKVGVTKAGPVDGGRSSIKITLTDEETKSSLVKTVFLEDSSEKDVSVLAEWKNVYNGTYTVTLEYSGDANHEPAQYTVESPIEVTGYVRPSYNGSTNNGGSTSGGGSNGGSTSGGGGSTGGGGGTSGGGGGGSSATPPANPKTDTKDYGTVNYDPIKGMVSSNYGIVTSKLDKNLCEWVYDGASALIWGGNADTYWKLMYIDGSYAKGSKAVDANGNTYENYHWEFIDGKWWTFDSNGFAKIGWLYDENYKGWFYIDVNRGMKTGWICVDGKWYYLEPKRGSNEGMMYAAQWTPDGYYVNADGAWDGRPAMQIAQ